MAEFEHDVAQRFAAAFHSRDVERVLGCFTPDVRYDDLFYGRFEGHDELRLLFTRIFLEGTDHEWRMTTVISGAHCTIAEWRFRFTVSDAVPRSAGRVLRFPGVSVFETRDGLCCGYREYFDRGAALLALGISQGAVARIIAERSTVQVDAGEPV